MNVFAFLLSEQCENGKSWRMQCKFRGIQIEAGVVCILFTGRSFDFEGDLGNFNFENNNRIKHFNLSF